jgi:hypothetical protein
MNFRSCLLTQANVAHCQSGKAGNANLLYQNV